MISVSVPTINKCFGVMVSLGQTLHHHLVPYVALVIFINACLFDQMDVIFVDFEQLFLIFFLLMDVVLG